MRALLLALLLALQYLPPLFAIRIRGAGTGILPQGSMPFGILHQQHNMCSTTMGAAASILAPLVPSHHQHYPLPHPPTVQRQGQTPTVDAVIVAMIEAGRVIPCAVFKTDGPIANLAMVRSLRILVPLA